MLACSALFIIIKPFVLRLSRWRSRNEFFGGRFQISGLAGRKELVRASLNRKIQGSRVQSSRHNSPNSRALADPAERENWAAVTH